MLTSAEQYSGVQPSRDTNRWMWDRRFIQAKKKHQANRSFFMKSNAFS